jgi:hypothetical protein
VTKLNVAINRLLQVTEDSAAVLVHGARPSSAFKIAFGQMKGDFAPSPRTGEVPVVGTKKRQMFDAY